METREQQASRLFNSACECIENEKYKEACDYLVQSSQLSGADARYILGIWLLFGVDCIDLKQDIWGAIFCLIKSAYKGNMSSKIFLKTFLDIDTDALNLTEENIKSIIDNIVIYKCKDIESITKEDKSKILEYIKHPYIVQPIMKKKQITPEKPTLLEQHNISIQHDREKHAKYKPKLKHNKEQTGTLSLLIELTKLIKENSQLKGEIIKLKTENMSLVNINETLEQEVKETKKEWQNMCDMLMSIVTQQQNPQQTQKELLQNTQINTNVIPQNEYMQPANLNQQLPTQNPVYTETTQPHQVLQDDTQYYRTQLNQFTNATDQVGTILDYPQIEYIQPTNPNQ